MSAKDDYDKGYAQGRHDADRVPSTAEILHGALIPGTLPSEQSEAYQGGYDHGKSDGKK